MMVSCLPHACGTESSTAAARISYVTTVISECSIRMHTAMSGGTRTAPSLARALGPSPVHTAALHPL